MKDLPKIAKSARSALPQKFPLTPHLRLLMATISDLGGKCIVVGGSVRDFLLGQKPKDLDLEVYGLDANSLEEGLNKKFAVLSIGKSFGIFKVYITIKDEKHEFDIALPRRENKSGHGHKQFEVHTDQTMSFEDAASRRDFTVNAMGIDLDSMELLDPHGGLNDLNNKLLRHVSKAFAEDPLRVLRAAQFAARLNFSVDASTIALCQSLKNELKTLSHERIYQEMRKLLLAPKPSLGLAVLKESGALILFNELEALINCPQEKEWHPEGDVWVHTLMVVDEAAKIVARSDMVSDEKLIVMAGALCHDLGKPLTTIEKDGRIKSPAHDQEGMAPTEKFLTRMGFPKKYFDDVTSLVKEHLKPFQLFKIQSEVKDNAIRKLCARVNIDRLVMVSEADFLGRTTKEALAGIDPSKEWLLKKVEEILGQDKAPKPILLGRHLMALGQKPSPVFGTILKEAFEAQLDGAFSDEAGAIEWARAYLARDKRR